MSTLYLCYCDAAGHQINTNIPYTLLWCIDVNNRTDRVTCRNLVRQMTSLGFWINNWSVRSKILSELWVWTKSLNSDSEPWLLTLSLNTESELILSLTSESEPWVWTQSQLTLRLNPESARDIEAIERPHTGIYTLYLHF